MRLSQIKDLQMYAPGNGDNAGQFVVNDPKDPKPILIGDYIEVFLKENPTVWDTRYLPAWIKRSEQMIVESWPMKVFFSCEPEPFDVDFLVCTPAQNTMLYNNLRHGGTNILSTRACTLNGHVWYAVSVNGKGLPWETV